MDGRRVRKHRPPLPRSSHRPRPKRSTAIFAKILLRLSPYNGFSIPRGCNIPGGEIMDLSDVLVASGRAAEIPEAADAYGWLIGSWDLDVRHYMGDVSARGIQGHAHFGWVLDGRAVQACWIRPERPEST